MHLRPRVHRRTLVRRVRLQPIHQTFQRVEPHHLEADLDGDLQEELPDLGVLLADRAGVLRGMRRVPGEQHRLLCLGGCAPAFDTGVDSVRDGRAKLSFHVLALC